MANHAKKAEPLNAMAKAALAQIKRLEYEAVLQRYPHVTQVLKVGLAFSGKEVRAVYKEENRLTKQESPETWTDGSMFSGGVGVKKISPLHRDNRCRSIMFEWSH